MLSFDLPGDISLDALAVKRDQEVAHRAREFIKVNRSFAINSLDPRFYRPIWLSYAGCNRGGVLRILAEKVGLELNRKGLPPLHKLMRHLAVQQKEPGSPFPVIVVDDGLFINSFWYIRLVDLMDGIFTGMTRDGLFRIKNGKLTGSVTNFRFNQNVFEMLMNTLSIGKAFRTEYGVFPFLTVKDFNFVSRTEF